MAEQQRFLNEDGPGGRLDFTHDRNPPASTRERDTRIEDYLDHFCAPLVGRVPYERRQELRREVGCHLEALVDALEELGTPYEEAVGEALCRFGDPRRLGVQWGEQWRRPSAVEFDSSPWAPMRTTLATFSLLSLVLYALLARTSPVEFGDGALVWSGYVAPVVVGLATGLGVRGRSALGMLFGLAPMIGICGTLYHLLGGGRMAAGPEAALVPLLVIQSFLWLPIGCASAGIGHWLRRRLTWLPPRLAWD